MRAEENVRNSVSESMVNVFEENRRKTTDSVATIDESISMSNINVDSASQVLNISDDYYSDPMLKMSKQEYLESIFGPSINYKSISERKTLRQKIRFILNSNYLNIAVIILVLVDSLCVTIELVIDLDSSEKSESLTLASEFFKYLGFSIISLFVIEITLKVAFLWRDFFKSKLEIIDGIIVYSSFILDVVFMNNDELSAIGTVLFDSIFLAFNYLF